MLIPVIAVNRIATITIKCAHSFHVRVLPSFPQPTFQTITNNQ